MLKIKLLNKMPEQVNGKFQNKEVTPSEEIQEITPDENFDGLKKVVVNKIPDEYIIPKGSIEIVQNGIYNVTDKIQVNVNTPSINDYYGNTISPGEEYGDPGWYTAIKKIPKFTLNENETSCSYLFQQCPTSDIDISLLNTTNVTNMKGMFLGCGNLKSLNIEILNTSQVTDMEDMFFKCTSLTTISQLDTHSVVEMRAIFYGCQSLTTVPQLNAERIRNISSAFSNCSSLINLGGLQDLGKNYVMPVDNLSDYTLNLSTCNNLTHDSLMNVINSLYNISDKNTQSLILGATNLAKLTAEEIAIATERGWTVS